MAVEEIVSGGQSGADRAALDVALALGLGCGGWVPKDREAEDGRIPESYPNLKEAESSVPDLRTEYNVLDSDATLVISNGDLRGGSKHTMDFAVKAKKPHKHIDLRRFRDLRPAIEAGRDWLNEVSPRRLNVAGPRASEDTAIYRNVMILLTGLLADPWIGRQPDPERTPRDQRIDVAIALRESVNAWIRHWDVIRWQVPYWYCTLATATAAGVSLFKDPAPNSVRWIASFFFVFGFCCLVLLWNLVRYDRAARREYTEAVRKLNIDGDVSEMLKLVSPYHFGFSAGTNHPNRWAILRTATFWFGLYTMSIAILSLVTFWRGVWLW